MVVAGTRVQREAGAQKGGQQTIDQLSEEQRGPGVFRDVLFRHQRGAVHRARHALRGRQRDVHVGQRRRQDAQLQRRLRAGADAAPQHHGAARQGRRPLPAARPAHLPAQTVRHRPLRHEPSPRRHAHFQLR